MNHGRSDGARGAARRAAQQAAQGPTPPWRWRDDWRLPSLLLVAALVPMVASAGSTICVIRSSLHPDYGKAIGGIRQSIHSPLVVRTLTGVPDTDKEIVRKAAAANPRFIVALGGPAARLTKTAHGHVPFLVGLVPDAGQYSAAGGMSGQPAPADEIETLLAFRPKVKTIGIFYDLDAGGSVAEKVARAARARGMSPIKGAVATPTDAPKVFRRLAGKVDAILLIPGRTVVASGEAMSFMVLESIASGVVLYTRSAYLVKRGALFQLSVDPDQVGAQLGRLLGDVILGKRKLSKVRFVSPRQYRLTVNTRTARIMGIKIPARYGNASVDDGLLTAHLGSTKQPTPFSPARVLSRKTPLWPKEASPSVSEAIVVFRLDIGRNGKITDHRLLQGSGPFVREAIVALKGYRIAPATQGDKPIPSHLIVTVRFQRQDGQVTQKPRTR